MLAATALIFAALGLGFGLWAGSVPLLGAALHLGAPGLGLVLLSVAIGSIGAMSRVGGLVGRFGARRCMLAAAAAFALAFLPMLAASRGPLAAGLGAALLLGAAMGALDVSMNAHASAIERERGRAVMSRLHAGFSLGGLGGALVASALVARGAGPAGLYACACGLVGLAAVAAALRARGRSIANAGSERAATVDAPGPPPHPTAPPHLPRAALAAMGLLTALAMICEGAIGDWSGVFAIDALHAPKQAGPLGYAAFSAAMVALRLSGDRLRERLGAPRLMRAGALVAAAGLLSVAGAPTQGWALAGFALAGVGLATLVPMAFSRAGEIGAEASGEAGAARALARTAAWGYGGFLLGPPAVSAIVTLVGLRGAFAALAAAAAAMLLLAASGRSPPAT